jgi:hypothetical protein
MSSLLSITEVNARKANEAPWFRQRQQRQLVKVGRKKGGS